MAAVAAMLNNPSIGPVYEFAYTVVFPILDADGDLVTGAAGLDSEVSKNGDTFADCTNEATEIATSSGMYYLTLTGAEMSANVVSVIVKTSTSGAKTTAFVLYPRRIAGPERSGTGQGGSSNTIQFDAGASAIDNYYDGCIVACNIDGTTEIRHCYGYLGSTQTAAVKPDWVTASPDADDDFVIYRVEGPVGLSDVVAVSGDKTAADNLEKACDGTGYNVGGGSVVAASVTGATGSVTAGVTLADDAITSAKFDESTAFPLKSADTGATELARTGSEMGLSSDALDDIADAVWDALIADHAVADSMGEAMGDVGDIAAIKVATDKLTFTGSYVQADAKAWCGETMTKPADAGWNGN